LIGEDPRGKPNNLFPYVTQVAVGRQPHLVIHGDDFPTRDGTGVRDYIHVEDLARGHVAALAALMDRTEGFTVNLGTGKGYSVLEVVRMFEEVTGREVPYRLGPRRAGDVAACFADVSRAHSLLGWEAVHGLRDMCTDAWRWQEKNPEGYAASKPIRWKAPVVRGREPLSGHVSYLTHSGASLHAAVVGFPTILGAMPSGEHALWGDTRESLKSYGATNYGVISTMAQKLRSERQ
jgi:hypothetical protein